MHSLVLFCEHPDEACYWPPILHASERENYPSKANVVCFLIYPSGQSLARLNSTFATLTVVAFSQHIIRTSAWAPSSYCSQEGTSTSTLAAVVVNCATADVSSGLFDASESSKRNDTEYFY